MGFFTKDCLRTTLAKEKGLAEFCPEEISQIRGRRRETLRDHHPRNRKGRALKWCEAAKLKKPKVIAKRRHS